MPWSRSSSRITSYNVCYTKLLRPVLDVLGNVDDDRAGAAGSGDVERLMDRAGQLVDIGDEVVVLGTAARDARRVSLLEGVRADQVRA